MKFHVKLSAIVSLFVIAMCSTQVYAQENESFKGLKLVLGAGMTSAGGTSTTTGSGVYTGSEGAAAGADIAAGTYTTSVSSSFNPNSFIGRVELGYDWAVQERGILGLSLSKDFKTMNPAATLGTTLTDGTDSVTFRDSPSVLMDGPYALALRAGYATTKDTMVYAKISYARSKISGTFTDTANGVGLGLGFEGNLSEHWRDRQH